MSLSKEEALIVVILERFTKIRVPKVLAIKEKVEKGETLSDMDIEFFEEVFADIRSNQHLVDGNEELQTLAAKFIHINKEITDKALANENEKSKSNY